MTSENPEFTTLFWNILSLSELFEEFHVDFNTSDAAYEKEWFEVSKYSNTLEPFSLTRGILSYSRTYEEVSSDNTYLGNNYSFYLKEQEDVYVELAPSPQTRLSYDGADDDTIFTGSLDNFNYILSSITQEPGKIIVDGGRDYEFITLVNEVNFFTAGGFKSTNRINAASLADPTLVKEYDFEYGQIDSEIGLVRSFKIRQSDSLTTWFSDGLFIVDGQKNSDSFGDGPYPYSSGWIFTLGGVYLGDFEEDYEYIYAPTDDQYRSTEIDLYFYDASAASESISQQVQMLFPEEFSALSGAKTAPIFIGYEGSYLGFDWLTSMPTSTNAFDKEAVSINGADAAIYAINQVYIALEDCDIFTGSGRDLIILADDLNNTSAGNVSRVYDFEKGEDKILIPTEVFLGFGTNLIDGLASAAFISGENATSEDHRIIYDISSGNLYHDIDGTGSATQQLIGVFINKAILSETDFLLGYGNGNDNGTAGAITGDGAFQVGVTLTAGGVSGDPDGDGSVTAYQWFKNGSAISNAISSSYDTTATGVGTYKVAMTYTDAQQFSATVESGEIDIVTGQKTVELTPGVQITSINGIIERFEIGSGGTTSAPPSISNFDPLEDFLQISEEISERATQKTLFTIRPVERPEGPLTKSQEKSFKTQQKAQSKALKNLAQGKLTDSFAYNQLTGQLFFDASGKKKGFGEGGGLLAVLEDTPAIGINNLEFL